MFKVASNTQEDSECQNRLVLTLSLLAVYRLVLSGSLPILNLIPIAEIWNRQGHGRSGFSSLPHLTIVNAAMMAGVLLVILAVVWAQPFKSLVLRSSQDHV